MNFEKKYIKYKNKYLKLKNNMHGGFTHEEIEQVMVEIKCTREEAIRYLTNLHERKIINYIIKTTKCTKSLAEEYLIKYGYDDIDKIILLDRREERLQIESMAYHDYLNNDLVWNKKKYYEINKIPPTLLEHTKKTLEYTKNDLKNFGLKHNIKTYYYEDIFIDKNMNIINEIFDYIGIAPNKEVIETYILSEEFKVRLDKRHNNIL